MFRRIDLHTHSCFSDGSMTPMEIMELALKRNIKAIALTDHDTIDGLHQGHDAAQFFGIEFINGIEISAVIEKTELHILGYFFNGDIKVLEVALHEIKLIRENRNKEMTERLCSCGIDISYDKLINEYGSGIITRAHFAKYLLDKGYTSSMDEGFKKYLSNNCKTFVPRKLLSPEKSLALIKNAGGVAILAHPLRYGLDINCIEALVVKLKAIGLDGIEAVYSAHSSADELTLRRLADKHNIKISGGSDFHGNIKKHINLGDGSSQTIIPYTILEQLKNN